MSEVTRTILRTPPVPLLVHPRVFDAFAWSASTVMAWAHDPAALPLRPTALAMDPSRTAFVLRAPWGAVPAERAWLHVGRALAGGEDAWALAPYAVDDATDQLYAEGRSAHETFFLATDDPSGLFWGLHDWAHFHNHGPLDEHAATEVQCHAAALAWLWVNRETLGLAPAGWDALRRDASRSLREMCARVPPGVPVDLGVLESGALLALARGL